MVYCVLQTFLLALIIIRYSFVMLAIILSTLLVTISAAPVLDSSGFHDPQVDYFDSDDIKYGKNEFCSVVIAFGEWRICRIQKILCLCRFYVYISVALSFDLEVYFFGVGKYEVVFTYIFDRTRCSVFSKTFW